MKKCALVLSMLQCCLFGLKAQVEAVTVNGDTVLLFDDGKWDFKSNQTFDLKETEAAVLPALNPIKFNKPQSSKDVAKGKSGAYELWYSAKKWERSINRISEASDVELHHKNPEGYLLTIYERAEIPLTSLRDVALKHARDASTEFKVVIEEMRVVNGREMLCLKFNSTIKGMKFTYFGYYVTFPGGSLQVLTMTFENLFDEFESDFQDFLNGVIIKE